MGARGGCKAFEVQKEFIGSQWRDNMVEQFHICRRHDHCFAERWNSTTSG